MLVFFFFQAEDGIRDGHVTGVQTCALPIWSARRGDRVARYLHPPLISLRPHDGGQHRALQDQGPYQSQNEVTSSEIGGRRLVGGAREFAAREHGNRQLYRPAAVSRRGGCADADGTICALAR